ncbi:unnamed protein product [Amaranthus hypochondriacus]
MVRLFRCSLWRFMVVYGSDGGRGCLEVQGGVIMVSKPYGFIAFGSDSSSSLFLSLRFSSWVLVFRGFGFGFSSSGVLGSIPVFWVFLAVGSYWWWFIVVGGEILELYLVVSGAFFKLQKWRWFRLNGGVFLSRVLAIKLQGILVIGVLIALANARRKFLPFADWCWRA